MKYRIVVALFLVVIISAYAVAPAMAAYSSISGNVVDSKTGEAWTHGGTIKIYDCANPAEGNEIPAEITIDGTGAFSGSVGAPAGSGFLCIKVEFGAGSEGTPAPKWLVVPSGAGESGNYATGTFGTDTGPNAVTLNAVKSNSVPGWPVFALFVATVAVAGAKILLRKRA